MARRQKQLELLNGNQLRSLELEKDFQQRVVDVARLNGWLVYSVPDSRRATLAGYPDLTMIHRRQRRIVFAELKREKGKTSEAQDFVLSALQDVAGTTESVEVFVWKPSDFDAIVTTLSAKNRAKNGQTTVKNISK